MVAPTKRSKTVAVGSTVSYGTGSYDNQAHGGYGKNQSQLGPTAGSDKGASPRANESPVKDLGGVTEAGKGRGYQTDAHSGAYHNGGQAIGNKEDNRPFNWSSPLHSEGDEGKLGHVSYNTPGGHGSPEGKAEHLPCMGEAHAFKPPAAGDAHAFRYANDQKMGFLRLSGHRGAHRIGGDRGHGKKSGG